jgi:hypothetical protein
LSSRKFFHEKWISPPSRDHRQDWFYCQNHPLGLERWFALFVLGKKNSYISHQTVAKGWFEGGQPHLPTGYGLSLVHFLIIDSQSITVQ